MSKATHLGQALFSNSRSATACVIDDNITVLSLNFMGGSATMHLNHADMRALANLVNETVEHLPLEVSL